MHKNKKNIEKLQKEKIRREPVSGVWKKVDDWRWWRLPLNATNPRTWEGLGFTIWAGLHLGYNWVGYFLHFQVELVSCPCSQTKYFEKCAAGILVLGKVEQLDSYSIFYTNCKSDREDEYTHGGGDFLIHVRPICPMWGHGHTRGHQCESSDLTLFWNIQVPKLSPINREVPFRWKPLIELLN